MRVIIAGGRDITDPALVLRAIELSGFKITEVVCGMARGVDMMGHRWAQWNGIPIAEFPADWDRYGMGAGHRRNEAMAQYADALIAVWDGISRGTKDMIQRAERRELFTQVYKVPA